MESKNNPQYPFTAMVNIILSLGSERRDMKYYAGFNSSTDALVWLTSFDSSSVIGFSFYPTREK